MNYNVKNLLFLFILFISYPAYGQFVITKQMQDRIDGKLPKEKLDNASYRCIYHFTQQVRNKKTQNTVYLTDTMALDIGKTFSVYYDLNKFSRDSLQRIKIKKLSKTARHIEVNKRKDMAEYKDIPGNYDISSVKGVSAKTYKNKVKQEVTTIDGTDMEVYKCIEKTPFQAWSFTADTLTVLGYVCQKATTFFRGRNYEAWFALEIPIKDGPWKLYGLPGLILKATTDDNSFVFEAVGLENLKDAYLTMDKDTNIDSTREQLAKKNKERREKLAVRHVSGGNVTVGVTPNPFEYKLIEIE